MSAATLREAASVLRGAVEGLTTDEARWDEAFPAMKVYADKSTYERLITHPAVGLALADWLDAAGADLWAHGPLHCADGCIECDDDLWMPHVRRALAVARAVLGGRDV